ncbi:hypothetical protein ABEX57_25385 [Bacillus anthracis]|uniref:hypothetical protein n=1 Tax=Bacillus anthracis TaxID=1392 RepID=UPI003D2141F3
MSEKEIFQDFLKKVLVSKLLENVDKRLKILGIEQKKLSEDVGFGYNEFNKDIRGSRDISLSKFIRYWMYLNQLEESKGLTPPSLDDLLDQDIIKITEVLSLLATEESVAPTLENETNLVLVLKVYLAALKESPAIDVRNRQTLEHLLNSTNRPEEQ